MNKKLSIAMLLAASSVFAAPAFAADTDCTGLPNNADLLLALKAVVPSAAGGVAVSGNNGLNFPMWATVMNKYGRVCAVATTGTATQRAWPASRVISAQKANTANSLSSDYHAISTANLYGVVQPGGSLYGLQHSNPVNTIVAYRGDASLYGTASDGMVGLKSGGVNVFGGGLAVYNATALLGAIGVSGDTSCADHEVAWKLRIELAKAAYTSSGIKARVPAGVTTTAGLSAGSDNIALAANAAAAVNTFTHISCGAAVIASGTGMTN